MVETNCNSIQFVNLGTNDVFINQTAMLIGGQTLNIDGNYNEICRTRFVITFGTGGFSRCLVIKKTYNKNN